MTLSSSISESTVRTLSSAFALSARSRSSSWSRSGSAEGFVGGAGSGGAVVELTGEVSLPVRNEKRDCDLAWAEPAVGG